nr:RNA-directed DNA polymerase, eukaryota [Tanacetum cinerariifolium]
KWLSGLCSNIFESFKVVFRGKDYWVRAKEVPGWILEFLEVSEEDVFSDEGIRNKMNDGGEVPDIDQVPETDFEETDGLKEAKINGDQAKSVNGDNPNDKSNDASKIANLDSIGPGRFKKSVAPCNGGSILSLMEEVVRVGLAQKAKKDWVKELYIKNKVNFVGLQETKIESIDLFSVKRCWGNLAFEYVHSDSIGNSGGILCVGDPNSFRRCSSTISDFFVILRGVWLKTGSNLLIVVVYAPHDYRDKRILWDYLSHVSSQ